MPMKMSDKYRSLRSGSVVAFTCFILLLSTQVAVAQKIPTALKLDSDADDMTACASNAMEKSRKQQKFEKSQFCHLWNEYNAAIGRNDLTAARDARNDMIHIVRGQVDTFYKLRKDGRRFKTKIFQQILDFLEIGGALSVAIMNGTRAKSIVGAAIGSVQGGRTSYNKNFDLLETQVLINKMNANRAAVFSEILFNIDRPARSERPSESYSWYAAKNDLRRYFLAGTYDNALDTLVRETGSQVETAENKLREIEKRALK